ncbi:MAG: hypothetical protein ACI4EG_15400 [Fusicatenibacter sp.]
MNFHEKLIVFAVYEANAIDARVLLITANDELFLAAVCDLEIKC